MEPDLERLIKSGDIAAFESLFRELHAPLCEAAWTYVRSQAVAEDIVQDLFFALWLRRETLEVKSLRDYLFKSVRNRALHWLRHVAVQRRAADVRDGFPEVAGIALANDDDAEESEARRRELREQLELLPPRTRLAVMLRLDEGLSNQEIAHEMGVSLKAVEKLFAGARARLRALLPEVSPKRG